MNQSDLVKQFADDWNGRGNEDGDCIPFWFALLQNLLGINDADKFTDRQKSVSFGGTTHKIDIYIPSTKVLIEQKSFGKPLNRKYLQSDGEFLTPFQQALRYAENMKEYPRWIITCNFSEFHIYYAWKIPFLLEDEHLDPVIIKLENLPDEYKRMKFLIDPNDISILEDVKFSKDALEIIQNLYDDFKKRYLDYPVENWSEHLYKICIRLVFCFYADDSNLFDTNGDKKIFTDYLQNFSGSEQIDAIQKIFDVLNLPDNLRGNFDDDLKKFPYVNGKLFEDKVIFPKFDNYFTTPILKAFNDIKEKDLHWEKISPPIFGALFESLLRLDESVDTDVRRQGGMHYTSYENIHKVIDPLFLDDLRAELKSAKLANKSNRLQRLKDFQNKLASLTFFDPACGSGNFLTETFISLRGLENDAIREMYKITNDKGGQQRVLEKIEHSVKVSINNFYGIEIHAYAADISRLAMIIAENQMLHQTENILHKSLISFPLKRYANIICANALQTDWDKFLSRDELTYIIGNPPFVGGMMMTAAQKADMRHIWGKIKGVGEMDYVSAWYKKTLEFIQGTKIKCAFVSTNSISQGQQALTVLKPLINSGLKINFAHKTFKWQSESEDMAAVHCVIIGFSTKARGKKFIYDGENKAPAKFINAYLLDAPQIFIDYRSEPLYDVPLMYFGSMPRDGGHFIIKEDDIELFQKNVPEKFIKPYVGADEFLNAKKRWCLWLKDFDPEEFEKYPLIVERIDAVKKFRLNSKAEATQKFSKTPHLFCQIAQPSTNYLLIPSTSSENRKYIPMGFMDANTIASNAVHIIPNAEIYHFGVLMSSVHMAWTRVVCGRLEMRYRYSKDIVYNNFIWCSPTLEQKKLIEMTAQKILNVRAEFAGKTLAWLYNETTMPDELRAAHKANDLAVMTAYGFAENLSEEEIVAALMKMYEKIILQK
ncbi:MAG: class I SAM-dependent DNA methyltransferase [Selenomonadaceae bacterium]|nr:class I SAM-dependent DNA methyltransferase [Selenomonadaceae bacterium]